MIYVGYKLLLLDIIINTFVVRKSLDTKWNIIVNIMSVMMAHAQN